MTTVTSQKILVLGGTGFVGHHVCELLSLQGHQVVVPTRRMPSAHSIQMLPGVTPVEADVHHPEELQALVRGQDAVLNLVAILHGTQAQFEHVHVAPPSKLSLACLAEGVSRLVHVSALGADLNGPSMYQRSKAQGEQVLLTAAQRDALHLTLLRPSVIFGSDDKFINLFARLQKVFPILPLAGANTRFQPVWVLDVARALVHCLEHPAATTGQVFEACGPEVWTLRQLVHHAGCWAGCPRPVLPLPDALGRLQALLMEWAPGPTLMSRDNLNSMKVDNVASGRLPGLQALGIANPNTLQQVFPIPPRS